MGKPPKDLKPQERRTHIVRVRLTETEKQQVTRFAKAAKVTESEVVRYALLKAEIIQS